jgi:two-component system cell cycle sensor histidine kinase/response regulator CckA
MVEQHVTADQLGAPGRGGRRGGPDSTGPRVGRAAVDRTRGGAPGGSIALVLAVATVLVGTMAGLLFAGRSQAEPYIFGLLVVLAMAGVFLLLALAAGILRIGGHEGASPQLKEILDSAPDGMLVTDARGRVIYANASYLDLIEASGSNAPGAVGSGAAGTVGSSASGTGGSKASGALGTGKTAADVRPVERAFVGDPGVSEAVYRLLKASREGRRLQEEVRVGSTSGQANGQPNGQAAGRWLRMRVRPLGDGQHTPRRTVWSIADVTRELERQENVFQELQHAIDYLDHAPAGFFSVDADGDISYLNATLAEWLDHDLAQIGSGGLKLGDIVAGEGAALLTTLTGAPGDVKTELLDIDLKTRHGKNVPARLFHKVAFGPQGTAGPSRTLVLNRARDGVADPLRAAEVRFVRFFHNTPMAIATVDANGKIARSNALFARLFNPVLVNQETGTTAGASAADRRSILAVAAERDRPALEAAIRTAADGQGEIAPVDAAIEGTDRSARFYATPVEEADEGDQEAAIVYALDTTEQRALETQVAQQQKMETIGRLAGSVAHDFNNLLGAIMMATDFLLNAHRPTDPSFQDIMQIKQNANRAAGLVRQLLAFSRKQTLRPLVVDLGEAVSDLTMLMRRLIGEHVRLNVVHSRDLWSVRADIGQFEQAIINLAVNARDAMPNGGTLTMRTANTDAEASARLPYKPTMPVGEYVSVEVSDSGTGIAPEIIDKIFDPFYTTKEIGKGTGLGLATVYGFIKQTGGFIFVDSELGKGTTFRIFIPRFIPAADAAAPRPEAGTAGDGAGGAGEQATKDAAKDATAAGAALDAAAVDARRAATVLTGHGTILLVEDEEGLRALNARGLKSRGYTVVEASNGVEAIEALEAGDAHIDLVVSDVMMPEMDGPTLFKELRQRRPDIRVIFVSGYAEDAFQKSLPDAGQFDFLPKPFTLKQLVAQVKQTMSRPAKG